MAKVAIAISLCLAVDVYEEKDDIVVKAELPGMDKNDIEVNISDSELTLKGEKKKEEKIEEENYYRCERSYGAFLRSVELPTGRPGRQGQGIV